MLNSSTNTSNMTNLPHAQSNSSPPPSGTESVSPSLPSNTLPPNSQHSHPKMTPPFLSVDPPPPSADPPPSSSLPNPPSHTASVSVIAVPTQSPRQSSPQDQTSPAPTTSLLPVVARPTQSPSDTLTNTPTNVAPSSHSAAQPPTSHPSDSKPLVSQPPTAPPPSAPTPTALPSTAQPPSPQLPSPQPSALSPPTSPPTVSPPSQDLPTAHPTKPPVSNPLPSSPTTDQCMEQNNNCEQNPSRTINSTTDPIPQPIKSPHPEEPLAKRQKLSIDSSLIRDQSTPNLTGDVTSTINVRPTPKIQPPISSHPNESQPTPKSPAAPIPPSSGLPLLRSSPVFVDRNKSPLLTSANVPSAQRPETLQSSRKAVPHSVEDNGHDKASSSASNFAKDSLPKKKRKVSWASEEKLVDVHFIDTRLELVRSWDPESQITLPFAPGTLHLFQSALREMESPKHGGAQSGKYHQDGSMEEVCAMPKVTSFEEARKKEHDMELERAQQAREELKGWLDAMTAEHSWRMPMAIVLPTECRMDKSTLEPYSIVSVDYVSTPPDSNHLLKSPASPPLHSHAPYERIGNGSRNIPLIPLSDNVGENGGGDGFEKSDGVGADGKEYSHRPNREAFYGGHQEQSRVHGSSMTGFRSHARSVGPAACNSRDTSNTMHDSMEHTSRPSSSSGHTRHHRNQQTEFNESSVPPIPRPSVQHILSLLQTSGLLKSGNGLMHTPMKGVEYSRHANEHHSREDGYRTQHDAHGRPVEGMEGYGDVDGRDGHNEMSVAAGGSNVSGGNGQIGPPPSMLGHSGAGYGQNVQQAGLMDVMPFPMPPIPPPPLGMPPSMLPLGLGIPMGMPLGMGMPLPVPPSAIAMNGSGQGLGGKSGGGGSGGRSSIGGGRGVETISRPKPKPAKQRKRCKYFGTKQGCRDGNSCMFAHN